MPRRRRPIVEALAFAPQAGLLAAARLMPYRMRLGFGGWLGRSAVALVPRLRQRAEANLRHVMPELGAEERTVIAVRTGDSFGRTFVEILNNPAFHRRGSCAPPSGAGVAALDRALSEGRGVILVSGHFGQWEAVRVWLKARGVTCAGLYRPTDNPYLNRIYLRNLEYGGTPIFAKNRREVRRIVGHLAKGGVMAILIDQYEKRARRIDFMGKEAPTSFVAAELALKFGAPMIPAYGVRAPDGEHVTVVMEPPVETGSAGEMMQRVNDSLGAMIRRHPEQYYWFHRRWQKDLPDSDPDGEERRRADSG